MERQQIVRILGTQRQELSRRGVKTLRLFGSTARDEASAASDVDLLVAFEATPSYSDFMKLRIFLEDLLGVEVDLVTENGLRERVRPQVEQEAIRVA
jgi:hypothetical protein